jgi:hypothetical protein
MDGLLLKFTGEEPLFWKLFGSIRHDLDRLYWVYRWAPWMGFPDDFTDDDRLSYEGWDLTSAELWLPGTLGRFADRFHEEEINLWGIESERDDPQALASLYVQQSCSRSETFIHEHARVWLRYLNRSYWEIFARKAGLLERLEADLIDKPWIEVFPTRDDQPEIAYSRAGWPDHFKR